MLSHPLVSKQKRQSAPGARLWLPRTAFRLPVQSRGWVLQTVIPEGGHWGARVISTTRGFGPGAPPHPLPLKFEQGAYEQHLKRRMSAEEHAPPKQAAPSALQDRASWGDPNGGVSDLPAELRPQIQKHAPILQRDGLCHLPRGPAGSAAVRNSRWLLVPCAGQHGAAVCSESQGTRPKVVGSVTEGSGIPPGCHGLAMLQCCQPGGSWAKPVPTPLRTTLAVHMLPEWI